METVMSKFIVYFILKIWVLQYYVIDRLAWVWLCWLNPESEM